jgi:hypothetical protein
VAFAVWLFAKRGERKQLFSIRIIHLIRGKSFALGVASAVWLIANC